MIFVQGHSFPLILHKPLAKVTAIQLAKLRTVLVVRQGRISGRVFLSGFTWKSGFAYFTPPNLKHKPQDA